MENLAMINSSQALPRPGLSEKAGLPSPTVLVVEDEAFLRRMICAALEMKGLRVLNAGNGREALDQLAAHPVDVVLTDWNMPVMSGRELVATMKAQNGSHGPPIIVLSCDERPEKSRLDQESCRAWLRKPCRISEIQQTVLRAIGTAR